ncbi:hypothetical protein [Saccharopolyspora griseoalba]|uniref:Uncharacterized protein n=1 Tax=Saccharopolyspora griseoalba TaxID=1431848 RepID=A0ABW2LJI9_9PSEU
MVASANAYWSSDEHYATEEECVFALAEVLREGYRAIVDSGLCCRVDPAVLMRQRRRDPVLGRQLGRGFAQRALASRVHQEAQWAELRSLSAGARSGRREFRGR